jgi:predicted nuclease of predicted toxin-antitoxin system
VRWVNFLLDQDVPSEIGRVLARAGHTITWVRDAIDCTASDAEVFDYGTANSLILVTCNRNDFLALACKRHHPGLLIVIRRRTRVAECAAVLRLIQAAGESGIAHNINFA